MHFLCCPTILLNGYNCPSDENLHLQSNLTSSVKRVDRMFSCSTDEKTFSEEFDEISLFDGEDVSFVRFLLKSSSYTIV